LPLSVALRSTGSETHSSTFEQAAKVVGVYVGAAYASGFLVVSTYLQRLGVRDAVPDLFRLRYIHVGVLCLLLPAFVLPAVYLQCTTIQQAWKRLTTRLDFEPVTALAEMLAGTMGLLMAIVLYGLLEFSTFKVYSASAGTVLVFWVIILILVGLVYKYPKFKLTPFWPTLIRGFVTIAGLFVGAKLIAIAFVDFHFSISLFTYFTIVSVCAGYVLLILKEGPRPNHRQGVSVLRVVFLIGLYYLSVLAFANLIFPSIPAERGGGSLDDLEDVQLCTDYNSILPATLVSDKDRVSQRVVGAPNGKNGPDATTCSMPVKLIEQTSDAAVVVKGKGDAMQVYVVKAKANLVFTHLRNSPWPQQDKPRDQFPGLQYRDLLELGILEAFVILAIACRKNAIEEYQR
jgi:hypothetical protein